MTCRYSSSLPCSQSIMSGQLSAVVGVNGQERRRIPQVELQPLTVIGHQATGLVVIVAGALYQVNADSFLRQVLGDQPRRPFDGRRCCLCVPGATAGCPPGGARRRSARSRCASSAGGSAGRSCPPRYRRPGSAPAPACPSRGASPKPRTPARWAQGTSPMRTARTLTAKKA